MVPGEFNTVIPCFSASPERGRTWPSKPGGSAIARPVGTSARCAGRERQRRGLGDRREQIEARGVFGLIGRQCEPFAVRQALHFDDDIGAHGWVPVSAVAMRATSAVATSSLPIAGHDSTPSRVTMCTVLRSPPITPLAGDTSLATIQSHPLRVSLDCALAIRFSVSAAKPTTRRGRRSVQFRDGRQQVGIFHQRQRSAIAPACFLIFCVAGAGDAPVGNGRSEDRAIGGKRRLHLRKHVAGAFHARDVDARRIGKIDRP